MALSNAERCRRYRGKRHDVDMYRDTLIEEIQKLTRAVSTLSDMVSTLSDTFAAFALARAHAVKNLSFPIGESESEKERKKERVRHSRASRLPRNWQPSQADRGFAESLGLDSEAVADRFRDHWHSLPATPQATKLDWSATWRNWCRRDAQQFSRRGNINGEPTITAATARNRRMRQATYEVVLDLEARDRAREAGEQTGDCR